MSADSHTVCPKCHPETLGSEGVMFNIAYDLGLDTEVRENIDYYMRNTIVGGMSKLALVFEYNATCWHCGWNHKVTLEERIPING